MAPRKVQIKDPSGQMVEGYDIAITESTERFSEIKLEDGTVLKAKLSVIGAVRVDDRWDDSGNPMYVIKGQHVVTVAEAPEQLRRKVQ